jgi:chemotaxis protein methyltransferase CheR
MDRKALARISAFIYREFGIRVHDSRNYVLEAKLGRLLAKEGYPDLPLFCDRLESGEPGLRELLARYITTGHTFFFREKDHFAFLAETIKRKGPAEPLIWCAASSTGEEAYSISITLLEAGIANYRIVASDLNPGVLAKFNAGLYAKSCFREMPRDYQRRYFLKAEDDCLKPLPGLRSRISIKRINIMDRVSFPRRFDYIFCRNMLIYFDEKSRRQALGRLMENLETGGLLFLGHTEAILDAPPGLIRVKNAIYRKTI